MWSPEIPKIVAAETLIGPYTGPKGWHYTRKRRDGEGEKPSATEAIEICRSHGWTGYIEWRSFTAEVDVDSCKFMRLAAYKP